MRINHLVSFFMEGNQDLSDRVNALAARLEAIELSDRLQSKHLTRIRRVQLACVGGVLFGALVQQGLITEKNRELAERVAIGAIAASISGLVGAEFLGGKQ